MENFIESRVILGIVCLIHMFLSYAAQAPWGHIKGRVLDGIFIAELIAVTSYIIYDNIQEPPYHGWFLAIIGYLFVYVMIFTTWLLYSIFSLLEKDKIYEMTITDKVNIMNKSYLSGTIVEETYNSKHEVFLPYSSKLQHLTEGSIQNVKYDNVLSGMYVLVKPV